MTFPTRRLPVEKDSSSACHDLSPPNLPAKTTIINSERMVVWQEIVEKQGYPHWAKVANQVTCVSFDRFRSTLTQSFNSLEDHWLFATGGRRPFSAVQQHVSQEVVVLLEGGKSNKWVADIMLHDPKTSDLVCPPYSSLRLGQKGAREACAIMAENPTLVEGKSLLLCDDASFSGHQLTDHVKAIQDVVRKGFARPKELCVVAPFMTKRAETLLTQLNRDPSFPLFVADHQTIPTLADTSEGIQAGGDWGIAPAMLDAMGLVCFAHKLPNGESFPPPLARGLLPSGSPSQTQSPTPPFTPTAKSPHRGSKSATPTPSPKARSPRPPTYTLTFIEDPIPPYKAE
jgi:hypothetical protein